MKKNMIEILCVVMCLGLLAGCGKKEEAPVISRSDYVPVEEQAEKEVEKQSVSISEYLGKEQVILYRLSKSDNSTPFDKAATPLEVYFFKDGQLSTIEGHKLGLTMGELAKMTDEEIWAKREGDMSAIVQQCEGLQLELGSAYMAKYFDPSIENYVDESAIESFARGFVEAKYQETIERSAEYLKENFDELKEWADAYAASESSFSEEDKIWIIAEYCGAPVIIADPERAEKIGTQIYEKMVEITSGENSVPVVFIVETDATGNNVQKEAIGYQADENGERYEWFVLRENGGTAQIYDSLYNWYQGEESYIFFCTRDDVKLSFDAIGNENVYVDVPLKSDSIKELFE